MQVAENECTCGKELARIVRQRVSLAGTSPLAGRNRRCSLLESKRSSTPRRRAPVPSAGAITRRYRAIFAWQAVRAAVSERQFGRMLLSRRHFSHSHSPRGTERVEACHPFTASPLALGSREALRRRIRTILAIKSFHFKGFGRSYRIALASSCRRSLGWWAVAQWRASSFFISSISYRRRIETLPAREDAVELKWASVGWRIVENDSASSQPCGPISEAST